MRSKLLVLSAFLVCVSFASNALAQSDTVEIKEVWARATPGGAQTGAVYVTLESPTGDRLTGASTPVAQMAELHSMTMD
jgi:periplasmic copper chaperone A